MSYNTYFGFLAAVILSAIIVAVAATAPGVSADDDDRPPPPPKQSLTYPNLGSHLSGLADAYEHGGASERESAERAAISQGGSMAVTIHLTANVVDVVQFLEDNGGDPRNVGEDYIEAYVPVSLLGQLSEQPGVIRVRDIIPPQPRYGNVTSQGVATHLATAWHGAGFSGQGVKVGIIDGGFRGWQQLQDVELPGRVEARCYTDLGVYSANLAVCDNPDKSEHGTAVAEAVIDIAPDAVLYIADPESKGDLREIVDWMVSQGVQVINVSLGWAPDGPGDGTSPDTASPLNAVDRAVASGITWVNAGGNEGRSVWYGAITDTDNDGIHEWVPGDEGQTVFLQEGESITVHLRWEDRWPRASRDLALVISDSVTGQVLDSNQDPQFGGSGHYPYEELRFEAPYDGFFAIFVDHVGGSVPDWIQLILPGSDLEYYTDHHNMYSVEESANSGMLAVGAAHFYSLNTIAPYSSRGPTIDGRIKPDIVGTACAASVSYPSYIRADDNQECWFSGTSQAAPHVAGLAALVKQANPAFTPQQVADYLKNNAADRDDPGPDNDWGYGFAELPAPPNEISDECGESISADGTTSGTWAAGCESEVRSGSYARYYGLTVEEESAVTITVNSAVDSYMYLRSGDARSGAALNDHAGDDDAGGDRNAEIEETLAAGSYTVEVTTFDPATPGSFTLTVSGLGGTATGPGPDPDPDPEPGTDECGESISADGTTSGTWAAGCESEVRSGSYARYYGLTVEEESAVTITVNSAVDSYMYLRSGDARSGAALNDHAGDDDAGGDRNAEIEETLAAGSYTVEVTTFDPATPGSFTLTVSGLGGTATGPGPDPDPDPEPGTDECGESISADGTTSGTWAAGCESEVRSGSYARYYGLTVEEESAVTITVNSAVDSYMYLRSGDARSGAALNDHAGDDDAGGDRNAEIEETLAAGSYTVEVTTFDPATPGSFTLTVSGLGGTATGPGPDPDPDPEPGTDECGESISADGTTSGTWAAGCESEVRSGSYARYYGLTVEEESAVTITVNSAVDSYMYLRSGDARSGAALNDHAGDDDAGGDRNAEIEETLAAGSYTVEVTTFDPATPGSFTLTVSGLGGTATGPGPDPDPDPEPGTDECGESISADGTTSGTWAAGCESEVRSGSYARYYGLTVEEESAVTITVNSAVDSYMYLRSGDARSGAALNDHAGDDDAGGDRNAEIEETLAAGSYTVEVTTFDPATPGSFTLTVSGLGGTATGPGPDPDPDPEPGTDECGESISADGTTSGTWAAGCESEVRSGSYARYYGLTVEEESAVTITVNSAVDSYMYLRSGDARSGAALNDHAGDDDAGGDRNAEIEETLAAGSYTVEVTTFDPATPGSFTLTVSGLGATSDPITVSEQEALTVLYNATNGANRANSSGWLTNTPLGEWYGVQTNSEGSVTVLTLLENGLNGTIPRELSSLRNLQRLHLDNNRLTGTIPPELGSLTELTRFTANNILVDGESVGGLTGEIPLELTDLTNLTQLALAGHDLNGELPVELGNLTSLEELFLWRNDFTGSIPSSLETLTNLTDLYLQGNQFTGCIPAGLEDVEDNDLHLLDLPYCGSEPESSEGDVAGDRAALEALYNAADGPNWENNDNWLTGASLYQWHGVTTDDDGRVIEVDLLSNGLTGSIPAAVGNLNKLELLRLDGNMFTGTLPSELGNLTNLNHLSITNSGSGEGGITGGIPPELGNLTELDTLYLGGHDLSGDLPTELSNLTKLEQLVLWRNQFSGAIPSWIGDLTQLYRLDLYENQFSGPIPSELGNLTEMTRLLLQNNMLSGPIPSELGNLSEMTWLLLNDNQLTGSIPTQLENLTLLETLYLGGNQFTGCIPAALFNVPDNDLTRLYDLLACGS